MGHSSPANTEINWASKSEEGHRDSGEQPATELSNSEMGHTNCGGYIWGRFRVSEGQDSTQCSHSS